MIFDGDGEGGGGGLVQEMRSHQNSEREVHYNTKLKGSLGAYKKTRDQNPTLHL